jgi:hypothetical protein
MTDFPRIDMPLLIRSAPIFPSDRADRSLSYGGPP